MCVAKTWQGFKNRAKRDRSQQIDGEFGNDTLRVVIKASWPSFMHAVLINLSTRHVSAHLATQEGGAHQDVDDLMHNDLHVRRKVSG